MRTLLIIYTDQLGTRFICPESETSETNTNIKKANIMRTLNQTKIEAVLLTLTASLLTIMFILFNNF